jgi:23S rRNA maturation mini-RNase III
LAQLAYLNDAALWQAARTTLPAAQRERLESLHQKNQRDGLTAEEQAEEQAALLALYRETVLVRAQAAVLLKQPGRAEEFVRRVIADNRELFEELALC